MAVHRCYWYHVPTGRVWATEIDEGRVGAVAGPLAYDDADPALLDYLPYSVEDAEWFCNARRDFIVKATYDEALYDAATRIVEASRELVKQAHHLCDTARGARTEGEVLRHEARRLS